jgi:tRNA(Ile)-lysidine synthase
MGSATPVTRPPPDAGAGFVAAVAAGLPAGFWSHPALIGVSGGGDSVALLLAVARLAPPGAAGRLVVVHAEHGLRSTGARDRDFTQELAASLGLPCVSRSLAVQAAERGREGLEARARRLRYACFIEVAHDVGARHVAVAHTADDQAETVLHRLLRGTGLHGLAGMAAARELAPGIGLVRPLLAVPRHEVRSYLAAAGQAWCEDETNTDTTRARNFVRHEILARCMAGPYPAAASAITRLAAQAATASATLRSAAELILDAHVIRHADGSVVVRTPGLSTVDPVLAAELFVVLWHRERWPQRDMTARHYAAVAALLRDGSPPAVNLPGGVHARRTPEGRVILRCSG